jgi:hypothetical protein
MTDSATAPDHHDQRKIRFGCIGDLNRVVLPIAYEVWLDDIFKSAWASREAMKLAYQLVRYMQRPSQVGVSLNELETVCQLNAEEVRKTLNVLRTFGVLESAQTTKTEVTATLILSRLQQLRVVEIACRMDKLGLRVDAPSTAVAPLQARAA